MSHAFSTETEPESLEAFVSFAGKGGRGGTVTIGPNLVRMTMKDFCELVEYVLTNSDLDRDDPRLALVDAIKCKLCTVSGYGSVNDTDTVRRLKFDE